MKTYRVILFLLAMGSLSPHLSAAPPLYGAYPEAMQPQNIRKTIAFVSSAYTQRTKVASTQEADLLRYSLQQATQALESNPFEKTVIKVSAQKSSNIRIGIDEQWIAFDSLRLHNDTVPPSKALAGKVSSLSEKRRSEVMKFMQAGKEPTREELIHALLYLHNTTWGINRPVGMMWLDAFRVPTIRLYLSIQHAIQEGKSGIGKGDVTLDALYLAAATQLYRLAVDMAQPLPFVLSAQYEKDLKIQAECLSKAPAPTRESSIQLMRMATAAQLKNTFSGSAGDAMDADRSWYRGAFFAGVVAAWHATRDNYYRDQALALAQRTKAEPGPNAMHDGNDLAISQTYLELHEAGEAVSYLPTKVYLDSLMGQYDPKRVEWSWCDALFMSPPTWARMAKVTGEFKYIEHMDKLWWQCADLLYDKEDHLFFRDRTYTVQTDGFQIRERNGEKVFWGRGNGWVMGALCRVIDYLPKEYKGRERYEKMFVAMCDALLRCQGEDGLWRSSLHDPLSYPMGETSSSTFNCYAFAWGLNRGLLSKSEFEPAMMKSWKALCACVNPESGRLEYVQLPADSPRSPVYKHCNVEYATGAFLLAGSEYLRYTNENQ